MKLTLLTICLFLGVASLVVAVDSKSDRKPAVAFEGSNSRERAVALRPLDLEIRGILDAQTTRLAELNARFKSAGSHEEAWEIQKLIRQTKVDTEIAVMEAQHRVLDAEGRTEEARSVAATLYALRNPEEIRNRIAHPEERPAPSAR